VTEIETTPCGNPNCPWYGADGTHYALDAPWCGRCARLGETLLAIMRHAFASAWSQADRS
jgi:hypothetical protein